MGYRNIIFSAILAITIGVMHSACAVFAGMQQYGITAVDAPGSSKLYFRREVRGLNYDVITLTTDPNPCHLMLPDDDIYFNGNDKLWVFYKHESGKFFIYVTGVNRKEHIVRARHIFPFEVEITSPESGLVWRMEEYAKENRFSRLKVPLDPSINCDVQNILGGIVKDIWSNL